MPLSSIENHPEKARIVQQILAGRPVRAIAVSVVPVVPFSAVQRYKANVILPMLAKAEAGHVLSIGQTGCKTELTPLSSDTCVTQATQESILDAPRVSLFRSELEKLRCRINRGLDKAESMDDLAPLAPLLNQAHKNLEILGRATGELESSPGSAMSIQIVVPWVDRENMPRVSFAGDDAIEVFEDARNSPKR